MHGKTSVIYHNNQGIFKGLRNGIEVMRYHSLIGERDTLSDSLEITAKTWDEIIMGVQDRLYPIHGIQFHHSSFCLAGKPQQDCLPSCGLKEHEEEQVFEGAYGHQLDDFRKAMRGIVLDVILDRKDKMGFFMPERNWLLSIRLP